MVSNEQINVIKQTVGAKGMNIDKIHSMVGFASEVSQELVSPC